MHEYNNHLTITFCKLDAVAIVSSCIPDLKRNDDLEPEEVTIVQKSG